MSHTPESEYLKNPASVAAWQAMVSYAQALPEHPHAMGYLNNRDESMEVLGYRSHSQDGIVFFAVVDPKEMDHAGPKGRVLVRQYKMSTSVPLVACYAYLIDKCRTAWRHRQNSIFTPSPEELGILVDYLKEAKGEVIAGALSR